MKKHSLKFVAMCICGLLLVGWGNASFSQTIEYQAPKDCPFVYMKDGKTYYQGEEYFFKTCNYLLTMFVNESNELVVGPHSNYYLWPDDNYPTSQTELSQQIHAHFKLMKDMGFNSVRIMNAGIQPRHDNNKLAIRLWHRSESPNLDPIPKEKEAGFINYLTYSDLDDNGMQYLKQSMQLVLDIAEIYDLKIIWVMGTECRYYSNSGPSYHSLIQHFDHEIVTNYKSALFEIGLQFRNETSLFAYEIYHENESFANFTLPNDLPVNQRSVGDAILETNTTIKNVDPNHYTTAGLFGLDQFFKLGVGPFNYCDFINLHFYECGRDLFDVLQPIGSKLYRDFITLIRQCQRHG